HRTFFRSLTVFFLFITHCFVYYICLFAFCPLIFFFFFSSRRRHTRSKRDWSSDVCSSDLPCPGSVRDPRRAVRRLRTLRSRRRRERRRDRRIHRPTALPPRRWDFPGNQGFHGRLRQRSQPLSTP